MLRYELLLLVCLLLPVAARAAGQIVSADDPHFRYTGRIDFTDARQPRLFWPGTAITFRFSGPALTLCLQDQRGMNHYDVFIDDAKPVIVSCTKQLVEYPVATDLKDGAHTAVIFRRTETDQGPTVFKGVMLAEGKALLDPPAPLPRKIEFYGDSITAGLGDESTDGKITTANSNNYYSYAAVTARALGAEYVCIAKSGLGITTTHGSDLTKGIITTLYDCLDPDKPHSWDFTKWTPDVVVINLGENDRFIYQVNKHPNPGPAKLTEMYGDFVKTIRAKYPQAHIVCTLGPMEVVRTDWVTYVSDAVKALNAAGDTRVYFTLLKIKDENVFHGGSNHPSVDEHQAMAELLIPFIKGKTGWK